jgi:hypothetical protein
MSAYQPHSAQLFYKAGAITGAAFSAALKHYELEAA